MNSKCSWFKLIELCLRGFTLKICVGWSGFSYCSELRIYDFYLFRFFSFSSCRLSNSTSQFFHLIPFDIFKLVLFPLLTVTWNCRIDYLKLSFISSGNSSSSEPSSPYYDCCSMGYKPIFSSPSVWSNGGPVFENFMISRIR